MVLFAIYIAYCGFGNMLILDLLYGNARGGMLRKPWVEREAEMPTPLEENGIKSHPLKITAS